MVEVLLEEHIKFAKGSLQVGVHHVAHSHHLPEEEHCKQGISSDKHSNDDIEACINFDVGLYHSHVFLVLILSTLKNVLFNLWHADDGERWIRVKLFL